MLKQKVYSLLESLVRLNDLSLNFVLLSLNSGFDKYLFQLITILKPAFSCCNIFTLSCVDKVTTGTYNFVSVIAMLHSDLQR